MYFEILTSLWIFLPAAVANSVPILAKRYKWVTFLEKPLDMGFKVNGNRILGDHKTWRGLILGVIAAILTAILQQKLVLLFPNLNTVSIINWHSNNPILIGFLLGFGALFGDAVKSFIKRRIKIKPGDTFLLFDQIDYIIGALLFLSLKIPLSNIPILTIILTWTILHLLTTIFAWKVGIKEKAI